MQIGRVFLHNFVFLFFEIYFFHSTFPHPQHLYSFRLIWNWSLGIMGASWALKIVPILSCQPLAWKMTNCFSAVLWLCHLSVENCNLWAERLALFLYRVMITCVINDFYWVATRFKVISALLQPTSELNTCGYDWIRQVECWYCESSLKKWPNRSKFVCL